MSHSRWYFFAFLAAWLAACAHSTAIDDAPSGDDDAGLLGPGDDGPGGNDASIDSDPGDSGGADASTADDASPEEAGACEGVICDSPPADACEGNSLRAFASVGTCEDGECDYTSTLETCAWGCDGDSCKPDPCASKTCNNAPRNQCADAEKLRVFEQVGTCNSAGECSYTYSDQPCEKGCAADACIDDLCKGVSCNSPPPSECENESTLKVFRQNGSCNGSTGACAYGWDPDFCHFGCVGGRCKDDPCAGILCNSPPANRCGGQDGKTLFAYNADGSCVPVGSDNHTCQYPEPTEIYCEFGCVNGACKDDPCAGKACNTPPARDCKDANTARVYASTGACSGGICSYQATETSCAYGCVNGVCKNCTSEAGCGVGEWCNGDSCSPCNNDFHCGASCIDCASSGKKCHAGSCVECTSDGQCGSGKRCENNACVTCNTSAHCGAACVTCSGGTPVCNGTQCVCDATSCGAGAMCNGTSCVTCNTAGSCGPSCDTCSGTTPVCGGATVGCVCTEASCGAGSYCDANGACAGCGPSACGNGRCDCGESYATCPSDCPPPCPTGLVIGTWTSGDDGWTWPKTGADGDYIYDFWVRRPQSSPTFMGGGNGNKLQGSYTQNLTYGTNVNLFSCSSATLSFEIMFGDDTSRGSDKSERLYVQCSGDGGANWSNLNPNPWPQNQDKCGNSYCSGSTSSGRSFPWTAQNIALPAACRTATTRFRFRAEGSHPFNMQNPGWSLRNVKVN